MALTATPFSPGIMSPIAVTTTWRTWVPSRACSSVRANMSITTMATAPLSFS
ncbi:hypothetical protein D3C86_1919140 [compost metagenome]